MLYRVNKRQMLNFSIVVECVLTHAVNNLPTVTVIVKFFSNIVWWLDNTIIRCVNVTELVKWKNKTKKKKKKKKKKTMFE